MADENPDITWLAKRYRNEIQPGDLAFVWQTGRQRAIRAILKIESAAERMIEVESEKKYAINYEETSEWRVQTTFVRRNLNTSHSSLREVSGLENLSVFHGMQQGTNFRVSDSEGTLLLEIAQ